MKKRNFKYPTMDEIRKKANELQDRETSLYIDDLIDAVNWIIDEIEKQFEETENDELWLLSKSIYIAKQSKVNYNPVSLQECMLDAQNLLKLKKQYF
jgi:hypothetical protein